jgi:hypothetical protein
LRNYGIVNLKAENLLDSGNPQFQNLLQGAEEGPACRLLKNAQIQGARNPCLRQAGRGVRRTVQYLATTRDVYPPLEGGQRSPSALLRAMSLSNGRWAFFSNLIDLKVLGIFE